LLGSFSKALIVLSNPQHRGLSLQVIYLHCHVARFRGKADIAQRSPTDARSMGTRPGQWIQKHPFDCSSLRSEQVICLIIPCSSAPTLSNNIIQKGLAFGRDWSGSVVNSGR
jgi:hypothetical protein